MNKNKKQKSIVLPVVLITSLMFILMLSGWRLAKSGFDDIAPIKNIEIEGEYGNLSVGELRQKVVAVLDGNYFTVNLNTIKRALLEMPWVEDASVRRQWPSSLHIKVIEKQAIARWGNDALLSSNGDLFYPNRVETNHDIPVINGPAGLHKKIWVFLNEISNTLNEMGFGVKKLVLDERRAWNITVLTKHGLNEIVIKLGREDTSDRLARFIRVFSNNTVIDLSNIATIDLRYPNGFAMRTYKKDIQAAAAIKSSSVLASFIFALANEV